MHRRLHLTLHQLRLLHAVASEGGVSRAAERLHLTQPTLSAQLRQLSDEIGLPLHERVGRKFHLTEAGSAVAATAARIEAELEELESRLAFLRGDRGGRLRLAVVSTAETFVPRLLGDFRRERQEVEVSLLVANRQTVVERLLENLDDLCIMTKPPQELPVEAIPILNNPLVVVAPATHPLLQRGELLPTDLAGEEFVLRERGSGTRLAAEDFLGRHGVRLAPRLELGSNEAVRQAVAGGLGLSILSVHALGRHFAEEGIAILPVKGMPIMASWQVVYPAGKRLTPLSQSFLDFLRAKAPVLETDARQKLEGRVLLGAPPNPSDR